MKDAILCLPSEYLPLLSRHMQSRATGMGTASTTLGFSMMDTSILIQLIMESGTKLKVVICCETLVLQELTLSRNQ